MAMTNPRDQWEIRSFIVWIEYFSSTTNQFPLTLLDEMINDGPIPPQNDDQPALPRWIDRKRNKQTIEQQMMHRFKHGMENQPLLPRWIN